MIKIDAVLSEAAAAWPHPDLDAVQASVMSRLTAPERQYAGSRPLLTLALFGSLCAGGIGGWSERPPADAQPRTIDADARYAPSVLLERGL